MQPITPYTGQSPEDIAYQRKLAMSLMGQATDASPVGHWTQALARPVQGMVGGMYQQSARQGEQDANQEIARALQGVSDGKANIGDLAANPWTRQLGEGLAREKFSWQSPQAQAQLAAAGRAAQMHPLQMQKVQAELAQAKSQTPEGRAQMAQQYGIQPGSPEYQQFVLTGAIKPPDEIMQMVTGMMKQGQQQAPAQPQQPRVIPQSFEGGASDPNLIQVQQAGAPAQAPANAAQMADTPIGQMDPAVAKKFAFALAVKGKGEAGKMMMESADPQKLGKEGQNEIDKKLVQGMDSLANLQSISTQFRPEFQQFETRFGMSWKSLKDKVGMLPPQERAGLQAYAAYKADAIDAFNTYIKGVTGAAMTESEAKRIQAAFPKAGEGIFDGDSPTEFKAKLDQALFKTKMAQARYMYAKQGGQNWQSIGLEQFSARVYQEGKQLEQGFLKQGMRPKDADQAVRQKMKQRYGIDL